MKYNPNLADELNRKFELEEKRKPKVIIEEKQIDSNIPQNQYILLDKNTSSIISIDKFHYNNTWTKMHELLHKENAFMPNVSDFRLLLYLLKENKARYADGSLIKPEEQVRIYKDITEVRDPWRSEYLDADFKVINKVLHINYNHRTIKGVLTPQNSEKLEDCLMKDKTPGIDIASWLDNPTSQGLPRKDVKKGDLYYYAPMSDNNSVVRFFAYSDGSWLNCDGNPSYSVSALGVRRKKFFSGNK